tara:strand:- start:16 stop:663 length:648 start_codon:yes stop_codon:yes gene_type:complete
MNHNKSLTINEIFSLAVKNHQENKLDAAQDLYKKILKIDPGHLAVLNNLGVIFQKLGENQKAKECFEKAIEINPHYANAYNNLGTIFKELGENQKAKECFEKAIEINPGYVNAHDNLSTLYIRSLDDLEKSINSSYKTLKIFHNNLKFINQSVPLFKLKHDVQQAEYLISKNYKIEGIDNFKKIGSEILNRSENKEYKNIYNKKILLTCRLNLVM